MKKIIIPAIISIFMILSLFMVSCGTVDFKVNFVVDGEIYSTVTTGGQEIIAIPQNPSKEGYTFDGWYWDDGKWQRPFTANSLLNEPLSSDMNVYAKWTDVSSEPEPEQPSISGVDINSSFLTVSGETVNATLSNSTQTFSFLNDIKVADGASYILASDIGCQNTIASKTVALEEGDNTYYLLVTNGNEQKLYTVTIRRRPIYVIEFNTDGGTSVETMHIEEDSTVDTQVTSKIGYTFDGWTLNNELVSFPYTAKENITFNAKYTAIRYSIEYHLNYGSNNESNVNSYTVEDLVILGAPTRDYYIFDGWFTNENFEGSSVVEILLGSIDKKVFYAKWTPIQYEINYELNGGKNNESNVLTYNVEQEISISNPSRAGYAFLGWFTNENFEDSAIEKITFGSNGNKTLYAKWQACENKLVFDGNGSTSGSMIDMIIETDETKTLSNNTFVKDGYTFKGWSTTVDGNIDFLDGTSYTMGTNSKYTIYAVWEANSNTLVFDANGGNGTMQSMQIKTDECVSLANNNFTKSGYIFAGWATSKDGSVVYSNGADYQMGSNSIYTIYAVWRELDGVNIAPQATLASYSIQYNGEYKYINMDDIIDKVDFSKIIDGDRETGSLTNRTSNYVFELTYDKAYYFTDIVINLNGSGKLPNGDTINENYKVEEIIIYAYKEDNIVFTKVISTNATTEVAFEANIVADKIEIYRDQSMVQTSKRGQDFFREIETYIVDNK